MEAKLVTADGCWQLKSVPDFRPLQVETLLVGPVTLSDGEQFVSRTLPRRTYRFYGMDSHGTAEYHEVLNP